LLAERQHRLDSAGLGLQSLQETAIQLEAQRGALLEGRTTADVETQLETFLAEAMDAFETTRSAYEKAATELALAQAAEETAVNAVAELSKEAGENEHAFDAAIGELGIDRQSLERCLVHDEEWISEQRKELHALREAAACARTAQAVRQRTMDEHAAKGRPEGDAASAISQVADARQQEAILGKSLIELKAEQQHDDGQLASGPAHKPKRPHRRPQAKSGSNLTTSSARLTARSSAYLRRAWHSMPWSGRPTPT
jgi:hypothetical protein